MSSLKGDPLSQTLALGSHIHMLTASKYLHLGSHVKILLVDTTHTPHLGSHVHSLRVNLISHTAPGLTHYILPG